MIKIFGERNTSTNAIKALIELNSGSRLAPSVAPDIAPDIVGRLAEARARGVSRDAREAMIDAVFAAQPPVRCWKHRLTDFTDLRSLADCHVILSLRHPASWILGLYRHPHHIPAEECRHLADFLRLRWQTLGREGMAGQVVQATELYNLKVAAQLRLRSRLSAAGITFSLIRHEDFARDQAAVFDQLSPFLDRPARCFQAVEKSTKNSAKSRADYADYYGRQRWKDEMGADALALVAAQIDWAPLAEFGYTPD